jgi:type II secretory pathway component GspD/PulD (secretin)
VRPTPTCGGFISRYIAVILLALSALSATPSARADDFVLEVIRLQYRSSAELLPLVQDFVAKDGVIKAGDAKLIIRTHPANLTELRGLIAKLDVPLRRLVITVKQLSGEAARQAGSTADAQAAGNGEPTHSVHVWRTDSRDDADRVQQVQVTEGSEAFIDVGREIPISDFAMSQSRSGRLMEQKTRYVGATTGFYVRPHLNGDTVSVDITPYQTTQSGIATPPEFNTQALHTTVSGKLGEWITIGASSTSTDENNNQKVIEYSTSQRGEQDRRILLRVTAAP